ncbi:response regulator [Jannaschia pohangensis]|uniref:DNA-binding transcriptional regulator NtrC n=1 Tax=Jannaschia pohangensis TaxID=390807 RepID=A0A1I3H1Z0_9RHOB|nr:response regulator [Jannaschia pohangensis]SFI29858.1 two component, sigma54 specific, transcriptional regulator, Fis family [Jannaschia pohangensis]
MDGTILVADDDRTIRTVLTQALTRAGCKVHATSSLVTLMRWVEEGKGDLVISDVVMPDGNGLEMLPRITRERPGLPVIVISAQNTIMTAIQAAEAEAYDYLPKPFDLPDLMKRASRALDQKRVAAPDVAKTEDNDDLPLVGRTPRMQALYRLVARVMNTDLPVMIVGESGTGKSLIARAIHDFSDRRTLPFVTATASDLVGFDGPSELLARAKGGSILFDEVGDLEPELQTRVVRMLDGLESSGPRIMASAQRDLTPRLDSSGPDNFRSDLYYRLAGAQLDVPALRERVDDIPLLAAHFLGRAERDGGSLRRFSDEAMGLIRAHPWPGNVRQLENITRRLVATSPAEEITKPEVEAVLGTISSGPRAVAATDKLSDAVESHLRRYFDLQGGQLPAPGLYQRILREVEAPLIEIALDATGGNQAKCADLLGINRNTLRKKITDLDILVTRRRKLM